MSGNPQICFNFTLSNTPNRPKCFSENTQPKQNLNLFSTAPNFPKSPIVPAFFQDVSVFSQLFQHPFFPFPACFYICSPFLPHFSAVSWHFPRISGILLLGFPRFFGRRAPKRAVSAAFRAGCEVHNWAQAVSSAEQAGASAVLVFNDLDVQDVGRSYGAMV